MGAIVSLIKSPIRLYQLITLIINLFTFITITSIMMYVEKYWDEIAEIYNKFKNIDIEKIIKQIDTIEKNI